MLKPSKKCSAAEAAVKKSRELLKREKNVTYLTELREEEKNGNKLVPHNQSHNLLRVRCLCETMLPRRFRQIKSTLTPNRFYGWVR